MARKLASLSLSKKAALTAMLLFVCGMVPLVYFSTISLEKSLSELLVSHQESAVRNVAYNLEQKILLRAETLQEMADQLPATRIKDRAAIGNFLRQNIAMAHLFVNGVVVIGKDGFAVADYPVAGKRASSGYLELEYFREVLATGRPVIGKPRYGRFTHKAGVAIAVPIKNKRGELVGVLAGFIGLTDKSIFDQTHARLGKTGAFILVSSADKIVIADTDEAHTLMPFDQPEHGSMSEAILDGRDKSQTIKDLYGNNALVTDVHILSGRWAVLGTLPVAEAFSPVRQLKLKIYIASAMIMLLIGGLMWWAMNRQLNVVGRATHSLRMMAFGQEPLHELPVGRHDEIGEMLIAFNKLQHQINRLTQFYAALSRCNEAIVRSSSEQELFQQICRATVEFGGMKMVWIGLLDQASLLVKPVASYGEGTEYLDGILISESADEPSGHGPTGTAIREGQPVWCQDYLNDVNTLPWQQKGAKFGWRSSASVPIRRGGKSIGAITFYSGEVGAFDQQARDLLNEMSMDISFALDNFDLDEKRTQAEHTLLKLSLVVEQSPNVIIITDLDANIEYTNAAFSTVTGYSQEEVIGKNPRILQSDKTSRETYDHMWSLLSRGEIWRGELTNRRKDGSEYIESTLIAPVTQADGKITNYLAIQEDVTDKKKAEERIESLAHFDQLTGLPNRTLLNDRFKYALSLAQRSGEQLAVMHLDLDHFKNINDTLGHTLGDQLLMEVATRIKATLREEDTVSRQGGDEFMLILPGTDAAGAAHVATKLMGSVSQPWQIGLHELSVTPSIGIAIYPNDGKDIETLLKNADTAMYRVKQISRNDFRFFTPEMQAHSARTLQLMNGLRYALARNELQLHYQPQLSIQDGHVIGAEALLRWTHPEFGMISPAEFIPIAEDGGQIIQIGEWVLRTAVRQLKDWLDSGMPPLVMAVNISSVQFRQSNIVELVTRILDEVKLPHEYLELELTEAVAMGDPQAAIGVIDKLYEQGIRMSIDDFGTGYSSLSYLKKFKVYKLKIDQSFVRDITDDPDDKAIVSAIINMASSLGIKTIAEGVETPGQLAFLRLQGCDEVQGYYFSKPVPAEAFEAFVKKS
jgi:diguanylate cyclase (GGDEF)-like protein/PAS domain S-box-containing protein